MAQFRKKPVVIEAFQLTYEAATSKSPIPRWAVDAEKEGKLKVSVTEKIYNSQFAEIKTLEGVMTANANDWIIKGVQDEIYPCKKDIFEQTYDSAETTFMERLILEEKELGDKIVGLSKGLQSDGFAEKVGEYQFELLSLQHSTMVAYRRVLLMRIKDLSK